MAWLDDLDNVANALSRKSEGLSVQRIALDRITPDPNQPRKVFDQKALEEMAQSIEARGILQPITVRTRDEGKTYVIRYGERRWRAAGLAGLSEIPAIVTESEADENELIDQIIENDQRADLSPIEIAEAVNGMVADGISKEAISKRLGRSRAAISMYAAISEFPEELAGEFLSKSPLRAAYDLFVAWKTAPEEVLEFVAENPDGVTSAAAAAFGRSIKTGGNQTKKPNGGGEGGEGEPLHVQRPQGPGSEPKSRESDRDPPEKEDERQAEARPKTPVAPKPTTDVKPVFVHVSVGGRPAKVQLPDMVEVAFDDGELMTIPASKIDPS